MFLYEDVKEQVEAIREFVSSVKHRKEFIGEQIVKTEINIAGKKDAQSILLQVVELFKHLGGDKEEEVLAKLDIFVSYGFSYIFGDNYQFKSVMRAEGKDIKVDFFLVKDGNQIPLDQAGACGGGVAESASLLVQMFFLIMGKGIIAPVLLLDTSFIQISDQYIPQVSNLLKELSSRSGIQVILFTHTFQFGEAADKVYLFEQELGKTLVSTIK